MDLQAPRPQVEPQAEAHALRAAAARTLRQRWDADALQATLAAIEPGLRVDIVASTGSTNADLLAGAAAGHPPPCLLVAEVQRQGRGRRGKAWHSSTEADNGASLTFSLSRVMSPDDWSGLSLAVGCALAEALDPAEAGPPRIGLKWPNDLWLIDPTEPRGGRKLGGILIETAPIPDAARPGRTCVVGVGLNVRCGGPRTGALPVDAGPGDAGFASGVAWLDELAGLPAPRLQAPSDQPLGLAAPCGGTLRISAQVLDQVLDQVPAHGPMHGPAQVLARLAPPLLQALRRFEDEGLRPFLPAFDRRDLLRGRRVAADGPSPRHGVGDGVAPDGGLRLRQDDGCITFIHGGEVSLRALLEATPC